MNVTNNSSPRDPKNIVDDEFINDMVEKIFNNTQANIATSLTKVLGLFQGGRYSYFDAHRFVIKVLEKTKNIPSLKEYSENQLKMFTDPTLTQYFHLPNSCLQELIDSLELTAKIDQNPESEKIIREIKKLNEEIPGKLEVMNEIYNEYNLCKKKLSLSMFNFNNELYKIYNATIEAMHKSLCKKQNELNILVEELTREIKNLKPDDQQKEFKNLHEKISKGCFIDTFKSLLLCPINKQLKLLELLNNNSPKKGLALSI